MAETPFFRLNNRNDWIFVANAQTSLANDDFAALEEAFGALGPGVVSHRRQIGGAPDVYVYVSDTYVIVLIQGTEGIPQLLAQVLGSGQVISFAFPGHVNGAQRFWAANIVQDLDTFITPLLPTRKVVFMGFSLGGAIAQLLGSHYKASAPEGLSILALGAPRAGDNLFVSNIQGQTQRIAMPGDPIPSLPPADWSGLGSAYPVPGVLPPDHYARAGQGYVLDVNGTIGQGEVDIPTSQIVSMLVSGNQGSHSSIQYLSALLNQSDLPKQVPGDQGYVDPPALYESTRVNLGLPLSGRFPKGVFPMASDLVQGTLYFRDLNLSEGWSEQVYYVGDVPGMLSLLATQMPKRAMFLSQNIEIHARRAAIVGGTKLSKTEKLASPTRGQYAEDTNEAGDAILYLLRTASNPRRIATFRGLPDSWIGADKLTPAGNAGLAMIDTYVQSWIDAALCIKTPSLLGLGKQQIQAMGNIIPGGLIQVTTIAAHGFSDGDIVSIQGLRGFPYLIGRWKIQVTGAATFLLNASDRYNITSGRVGTVLGVDYVGTTVTSFGFDSVGHRNTGRPFFQPRGRRSKKVIHS